ncbi:MAG: alpha/beta hydrolase [Flavobacteriaceae bacterium]|nr:alpha/beta hydrolase [Flavobacteriaceae bacterium]
MKSNTLLLWFALLLSGCNPVFGQVERLALQFDYNDVTYDGSIEIPAGKTKGLIVLIPGHGPTDFVAGAEYGGLRDYFTQIGYAVAFWDKAGCGKSGGTYNHQQSIDSSVEEALVALGKIRSMPVKGSERIGLWGISRAGWICPLLLAKNPSLAFWISVSGTDQFENSRYMLQANLKIEGRTEPEIAQLMKEWDHYQKVLVNGGESLDVFMDAIPNLMNDPYFNADGFAFTEASFKAVQGFYQNGDTQYHPTTNLAIMVEDFDSLLRKIDLPVLAICGEKDSQIDWRSTLALYRQTIGINPKADLSVKTFANGNHTMQQCETGGINEDLSKFGYAQCKGYYEAMGQWLEALTDRDENRE